MAVHRELLANLQGGLCPGVVVGVSVRAWWGFRLEERRQVGEGHRDTWAEPSRARSSSPEAEHRGSVWMSPQTSVQS